MDKFLIVCVLVIAFVMGVGVGDRMAQSHEIPYPTTFKQMDIQLKLKAQQHAIDKQMIDREIELKKLELDLIRARKEEPYFNQTCILK